MTTTLDARRTLLLAASRLLSYPDRALWTLLPDIAAHLREYPASDSATTTEAMARLASVANQLRATDVHVLEARYVATFDFHEPASLYLTAHELGDSRRRGQALIELRALLRASGFEEAGDELPDYLPLLLEFLAHTPGPVAPAGTADPIDGLERRLAAVCERICAHLEPDNPYRDVFVALRDVLPDPADANLEQRFSQREQADTGEMPYPLHYD